MGYCQMFGQSLEIPAYDNVEMFVARLCQLGHLGSDHLIGQTLGGDIGRRSVRSVQRRFSRIIGLTANQVFQIERARHAAALLRDGRTILDTVGAAGYFDQAHLTRWAKILIGETSGEIANTARQGRLSFLYKTDLMSFDYIRGR